MEVLREVKDFIYVRFLVDRAGVLGGNVFNSAYVTRGHKDDVFCIINKTEDFTTLIESECYADSPNAGDLIYVEPKARITRDFLRSTGYKITLDRFKAKTIVVPRPDENDFHCTKYGMVAYDKDAGIVYVINLYYTEGGFHNYDADYKRIQNEFIRFVPDAAALNLKFVKGGQDSDSVRIYSIPNVESYIRIIEAEGNTGEQYIFDDNIYFEPTNDVSIEALEVWSHQKDPAVLEKCIIGCNWREYPTTMKIFLRCEAPRYFEKRQNRNLQMVLDKIKYWDRYYSDMDEVSAKDWNMLQKWIMHKLGTGEAGKGFVSSKIVSNLHPDYAPFIRSKLAVAPYLVQEEGTFPLNNLMNSVNNE